MKWNHNHIRKVRELKERDRDSIDLQNALKILSDKIYSDDTHFLLELIQNAEDEGAQELQIVMEDHRLIVYNDGKVFDEDDVFAICSIGQGKKKHKIGFMGIGFKSVFNITDSPQVISGSFNFTIKEYRYPEPNDDMDVLPFEYNPDFGTIFILPYKKESPDKKDNLKDFLSGIDDKILLFLNNIKKLAFTDKTRGKDKTWSYSKSANGNSIELYDSNSSTTSSWYVFNKTIEVTNLQLLKDMKEKKGLTHTTISLVFPMGDEDDIKKCKDGPIYCFLPTKHPAQLPFLLQADFRPSAGREDIDESSPWNRWLLKQLAHHSAESLLQLRYEQNFKKYFYEFIPRKDEFHNPKLKETFLDHFHEELKKRNIVYCIDGNWHSLFETTLVDVELDGLIDIQDATAIFEERTYPVNMKEFTQAITVVLKSFDIKEVGIDEIGDLFANHKSLHKKDGNWLLEIYDYLAKERQKCESDNKPEVYAQLQYTPFLLGHDNKFISPVDPDVVDRIVTYHTKDKDLGILPKIFEDGELVFLHKLLSTTKGKKKDQLKRIGDFLNREYSIETYMDEHKIINNVILPKFENGLYENYSIEKIVRLTNYIRENIRYWINKKKGARTNVSEDELFKELGQRLKVQANWKEGRKKMRGFLFPNECYIAGKSPNHTGIYSILFNVDQAPFIAKDYYNSNILRGYSKADMRRRITKKSLTWDEFFEKIGAWKILRVKRMSGEYISRYTRSWKFIDELPGPDKVNDDGYTVEEDWEMPEFRTIIDIYKIYPRKGTKLLREFQKIIKNNWSKYSDYKKCTISYKMFSNYRVPFPGSSFLYELQNRTWFSVNRNPLARPKSYYFGTAQNQLLLPRSTPFIYDYQNKRSFYRDIGVVEIPTKDEVFQHFKVIHSSWKTSDRDFPRNASAILSAIYQHLLMNDDKEEDYYRKRLNKFKGSVFYPTAKKFWWKPSEVYWFDHADTFGSRREYLETSDYPSEAKETFNQLGVLDDPTVDTCIEAILDLGDRKALSDADLDYINNIYLKLNELLINEDRIDFGITDKPIFLTRSNKFNEGKDVFWIDNVWFSKFDLSEKNILKTNRPVQQIMTLLKRFDVKPISSKYGIRCKPTDISGLARSEVEILKSLGRYIYMLIKYNEPTKLKEYNPLIRVLERLEVKNVSSLTLDLIYKRGGKIDSHKNLDTYLHIDGDNHVLYIVEDGQGLPAIASSISDELYRIFESSGTALTKVFIKALLEADINDWPEIAKEYNIPKVVVYEVLEDPGYTMIKGEAKSTPATIIPDQEEEEIPVSVKKEASFEELFTPAEFRSLSNIKSLTIMKNPGIDQKGGTIHDRKIKLKFFTIKPSGSQGSISTSSSGMISSSGMTTEIHAINFAMFFEEQQKRSPKDVHNQKRIGYDIHSSGRYIEVKGFKNQASTFTVTPHEYEAAKIFRDKYYIYVISQLTSDYDKVKIEIIKNPVVYLDFIITGNRKVENFQGQETVFLNTDSG